MGRVKSFYQHLLALEQHAPERHVEAALRLLVELADADVGYLELPRGPSRAPYWRGHAANDSPVSIRDRVSRTIIETVIADCRPIECPCAQRDPNYAEIASVRQNEIGRVLCVSIGRSRSIGALYIQGQRSASPFDRQRVESFARRIVPIAPRLLRGPSAAPPTLADELRALRERRVLETLDRCDDNIARAARELSVGRALIYSIAQRSPGVYPDDPDDDS